MNEMSAPSADLDSVRASVTRQAGLVRDLKKEGADPVCFYEKWVMLQCTGKRRVCMSYIALLFPCYIFTPFPFSMKYRKSFVLQ